MNIQPVLLLENVQETDKSKAPDRQPQHDFISGKDSVKLTRRKTQPYWPGSLFRAHVVPALKSRRRQATD